MQYPLRYVNRLAGYALALTLSVGAANAESDAASASAPLPYDTLLYLAGAGALPLNAVDNLGRPLLITAIEEGSPQQVQQLLERGFDPESSFSGYSAVFFTLNNACKAEKLTSLIKAGANLRRRDDMIGAFPIHKAVQHQNLACFEILIEYGASVDVVDDRGESPYFYALDNANQKAIKRLWQLGVDPTRKTNEGIDLFYYAVILEESALVRDLLILHLTHEPRKVTVGR